MARINKVVIIGGGIAGALLAKHLQNHAHVTLIDPKEYFNIAWAALRSMVDPSFAERSLINYSEFLPKVTLVNSCASMITDDEVLTTDGHRVPYDYLVIATGHVNSDPVTRSEGLQKYQEGVRLCISDLPPYPPLAGASEAPLRRHGALDKIKSSDSILIIGGGPTGVELAGEIADKFSDKKITMVHRGSRLLEFIGSKASHKTLEWLTSKKVEVILNQSVDLTSASDGTYQTSGGETIVADSYFKCIGKPLGSSWLQDTFLKSNLEIQGRLVVDKHLRVEGRKNIFAIGDITNIPELKQGFLAMKHADVASKNLRLLLEGENHEHKLATYSPGRPMALVSLGRKEAVAQINRVTISGCLPGFIKSGDLFVGKTRKTYGLMPNV